MQSPATHSPAPPPIPIDAPGVILVGGTFDPPHLAHARLPALARAAAGLDDSWLLYVPAARSPFKTACPAASDADRLAMLHLALGQIPRAAVWNDELARAKQPEGPSFTIDTLRRLRAAAPSIGGIRLLVGADQALAFHRWREPRSILAIAPALVMLRGTDTALFLDSLRATGFWTGTELETWAASVVPVPQSPISSTRIREILALAAPQADAELAASLDPGVLGYIRTRGLYRR